MPEFGEIGEQGVANGNVRIKPTYMKTRPASMVPLCSIVFFVRAFLGVVIWAVMTMGSFAGAGKSYTMEAMVRPMSVGEDVDVYGSLIVINRPSPGDNFWYRLAHRIDVVKGQLPPGIQLVQKGAGFHELARFAGVPTRAGVFQVELMATMADGAKTNPLLVTFEITDSRSDILTVLSWGTERLVKGVEPMNAGFLLVDSNQRIVLAPFEVKASGLPDGIRVMPRGQGNYMITGQAVSEGIFDAEVQFQRADDGTQAAVKKIRIEVISDEGVSREGFLSVIVDRSRPLRVGSRYVDAGYRAPWFTVNDSNGRWVSGPFQIEAKGLPDGMSFSANGFLVGKPTSAGVFDVTATATSSDGVRTAPQTFTMEIAPALTMADRAGVYDCVIERNAAVNGNMGGRLRVVITAGGQVSGFVEQKAGRVTFGSAAAKFDAEEGTLTLSPVGQEATFTGRFELEPEYDVAGARPFMQLSGTVNMGGGSTTFRGTRATVRNSSDPSPYAGPSPINILFVQSDTSSQSEGFGGAGFMAMTITASGNATISVWAADGSAPSTLSTSITETSIGAFVPGYFTPANSSGGSTLLGELFVNREGDAAGRLSWYQPPSKMGRFPEGIDLIVYEGVIGSRHVVEPQGLNRLGMDKAIRDAELDLIGEGVLSASEVRLTLDGVKMKAVPAAGQVSDIKMSYSARSGLVSGTMTIGQPRGKSARTVTFRGMGAPDGLSVMGHYTVADPSNGRRSKAGMMKIAAKGE